MVLYSKKTCNANSKSQPCHRWGNAEQTLLYMAQHAQAEYGQGTQQWITKRTLQPKSSRVLRNANSCITCVTKVRTLLRNSYCESAAGAIHPVLCFCYCSKKLTVQQTTVLYQGPLQYCNAYPPALQQPHHVQFQTNT